MSTMKRYATANDLPALHRIWAAAFPEDSEEARNAFFAVVPLSCCMVAECDGAPVSMVFSLTAHLNDRPLQYIYAAATLPAYRGRGLFGDLLMFAQNEAKRRGYIGSFLRPAEPSLATYYARFGYTQSWYCRVEHGEVSSGDSQVTPRLLSSYREEREQRLPVPHIVWPSALVDYAARTAGGVYACGDAVALCDRKEDVLYIKEWLGDGDPAALCAALGCTRYEARMPSNGMTDEPFVLYHPFTETDVTVSPYVGIVLD